MDTTSNASGLDPIPLVLLSDGYWTTRGTFLAETAERHGSVFRARHLKTDVVFAIGPAANRQLLATQRLSCSHRGGWAWVFGGGDAVQNLLTMDPPDHEVHRRILAPAFAASRVHSYLPLICRVLQRRLARWTTRVEIDAYEETRTIAFDLAAHAFLGLQPGPEVELGRAVYLHGAGGRAGAFTALLRRLIAARRAAPYDDALGLMARALDEQGRPLSEAQILAHAEILLVAGYETTASLAAWTLYLLAIHPEEAHNLAAAVRRVVHGSALTLDALEALPALDRLVLEAERLYPPVPTAPRRLLAPIELAGYRIPAGTLVFYAPAGTHMLREVWRDPQRFDPQRFDPERFGPGRAEHRRTPYALVGFGGGPRTCIGQSFARLQLRLLVAHTLQHFILAPVPGQIVAQRYGVTARPLRGLRLRVLPRPS